MLVFEVIWLWLLLHLSAPRLVRHYKWRGQAHHGWHCQCSEGRQELTWGDEENTPDVIEPEATRDHRNHFYNGWVFWQSFSNFFKINNFLCLGSMIKGVSDNITEVFNRYSVDVHSRSNYYADIGERYINQYGSYRFLFGILVSSLLLTVSFWSMD